MRIRGARRRLNVYVDRACLAVSDGTGKGAGRSGCTPVLGRLKSGLQESCCRGKTPVLAMANGNGHILIEKSEKNPPKTVKNAGLFITFPI